MKTLAFFLLVLMIPLTVHAKQSAPPIVDAVVHEGIRYSVKVEKSKTEFSVYLLTELLSESILLAETALYRISYKPLLEKDVQEIFPASMEIDENDIIVTDERGRLYRVSVWER